MPVHSNTKSRARRASSQAFGATTAVNVACSHRAGTCTKWTHLNGIECGVSTHSYLGCVHDFGHLDALPAQLCDIRAATAQPTCHLWDDKSHCTHCCTLNLHKLI